MDTSKDYRPFDRLPPEVIVQIFCGLPDLKSVLGLGHTSHRLHGILLEHESTIARQIAITILQDGNPGLIKLAFMACETRVTRPTTVDSVREFLERYVHRGKWPSQLYRLRAVGRMPKINAAINLLMDWIQEYAFIWPAALGDSKRWTDTERSRQMRLLYILEVGVTLLEPVEATIPEGEFERLGRRYWETFSKCELTAAHDVLWRVVAQDWTGKLPEHLDISYKMT